jgi:hypothetical protein
MVMSARIAACLLCLMMVGASLDGLPDPPIVKPQGNQNNPIFQLHHPTLFLAKSPAWDCLASAPHFWVTFFSIGQTLQNRGPSYASILVRQASDTSPPWFS